MAIRDCFVLFLAVKGAKIVTTKAFPFLPLRAMVIRSSSCPQLFRKFWGQIIYATPGCGKSYVARNYRHVWDGDDFLVMAISEASPTFVIGAYGDPRRLIGRYLKYCKEKASKRVLRNMHDCAYNLMRAAADTGDVVLTGTMELMHLADGIFIQRDYEFIKGGFKANRQYEEETVDTFLGRLPIHNMHGYLDHSWDSREAGERFQDALASPGPPRTGSVPSRRSRTAAAAEAAAVAEAVKAEVAEAARAATAKATVA